ncbi:uncharacterized protein LOC108987072 [Juglans regia]|uniref:Uncharacterized protein LOC108987072 n=1 Tax=Juglans regia TaxID=51240 RepID=A0A2I4E7V0_JUGRE|nr:uncharacterized protein LOC108987072 [Juglans regia]
MNPDEGVRGALLLDFRNRAALANLYRESSMLTFEVQKIQSSQNIVAKLTSLPFQQCKHAITTTTAIFSSLVNNTRSDSVRETTERSSEGLERERSINWKKKKKKMSDWGPVFVAVVLFILLTPGLLIQMPGKNRYVEFGNLQTSGVSILVHSVLYFALMCIFLLAIGVHMYLGS